MNSLVLCIYLQYKDSLEHIKKHYKIIKETFKQINIHFMWPTTSYSFQINLTYMNHDLSNKICYQHLRPITAIIGQITLPSNNFHCFLLMVKNYNKGNKLKTTYCKPILCNIPTTICKIEQVKKKIICFNTNKIGSKQ